jgi:hypothetical protein
MSFAPAKLRFVKSWFCSLVRLVYGGPNGAEKPLFGNLQGYKCASTTAARTVVAASQSLFE